jgi:hypothetical protein
MSKLRKVEELPASESSALLDEQIDLLEESDEEN